MGHDLRFGTTDRVLDGGLCVQCNVTVKNTLN